MGGEQFGGSQPEESGCESCPNAGFEKKTILKSLDPATLGDQQIDSLPHKTKII